MHDFGPGKNNDTEYLVLVAIAGLLGLIALVGWVVELATK